MELVILNDAYKHLNGADNLYRMKGNEQLKYTNNVRDILCENKIQHIVIPIIANRFPVIPDEFQIWNFSRVFEGDNKTNNFVLTCHIESQYLLENDYKDVEILQYAETIYNLNLSFDTLKMWMELDTLLLPEEH